MWPALAQPMSPALGHWHPPSLCQALPGAPEPTQGPVSPVWPGPLYQHLLSGAGGCVCTMGPTTQMWGISLLNIGHPTRPKGEWVEYGSSKVQGPPRETCRSVCVSLASAPGGQGPRPCPHLTSRCSPAITIPVVHLHLDGPERQTALSGTGSGPGGAGDRWTDGQDSSPRDRGTA